MNAQDLKGLTVKQAWWAGYRAGKSLPPETPRHAALAHQPVPVDLEQFREAVEYMLMYGEREQCIRAGDMLQAIIDNAGKVESVVDRALTYLRPHLEAGTFAAPDWAIQLASILTGGDGCGTPIQPAPVVDDAVRELIQKWRKDADDELDCLTSWKLVRRRCADELEAALTRAQGLQS